MTSRHSEMTFQRTPLKPLNFEICRYFDLQGHRGGRGEAIEDTLWGFAHGLMDGVTTLELDVGISKDGEAIVWHDESFTADKCRDTANAINDPMYPYVGKYIANLTLAQIKTLDCGSNRLAGFPYQLTLPGQKISTLQEFFDFVKVSGVLPVLVAFVYLDVCADLLFVAPPLRFTTHTQPTISAPATKFCSTSKAKSTATSAT